MLVSTSVGARLGEAGPRATEAEALGYGVLSAEETSMDPFTRLTLAAEHSERALLVSAIALAFPRSPYVMAQTAWGLQDLSGGRFMLGLGTQVKGHMERRFSVPWAPPGPRLRDYVLCLRAIWSTWQHGTKPAFESEHYRFQLMNPPSNPGPIEHPDIPVLLAAVNPYNARLAGSVGDGIVLHAFTSFSYAEQAMLPAMRAGAERAGRDPSTLHVRGGGFVVTGRTEAEVAEAREQARRRISYYASTRSYSRVMAHHGWEDEAAHLHRLSIDQQWDEMAKVITDEMLDEFCVTGTWDAIGSLLRRRYGGVATQISLPLDPRTPEETEQVREIIAGLA